MLIYFKKQYWAKPAELICGKLINLTIKNIIKADVYIVM